MSLLLVNANALHIPLADQSVHCVVTSPPYWGLRDYGIDGQLGLEQTPAEYVARMVQVFREVWRVLRDDGTLWLNLGDSYAAGKSGRDDSGDNGKFGDPRQEPVQRNAPPGLKPKDLCGIPWRVAFALQEDGWYLRSDIIWSKPNPMPESVTDRPTKAHEYLFLLAKSEKYYYDQEAIREPVSGNTHARISQDLAKQVGSFRANGGNKTNGPMKAVLRGSTRKLSEEGSGIKANRSMEAALALQVEDRNSRTVWTIPTAPYSGAHFATYPPALVEPCTKAGTSERGVCPVCGTPWKRLIKKEGGTTGESWVDHSDDKGMGMAQPHESGKSLITFMREADKANPYRRIDLGWQPTCDHDAEPIPAVVLDPFAGSGTTLMVARALGRNAVGLDLSYAYLHDQARARLSLDRLEEWQNGRETIETSMDDLPMFTEAVP